MKATNGNIDIANAIRTISGVDKMPMPILATVIEVDEANMTCDVLPISGGAKFLDVLLAADLFDNGMYFKPKVDSIVGIVPLNANNYIVVLYSDVDEVWLRGNDFGGLVKVSELVTKLNALENAMNTIITWGAGVTPPLAGILPFTPTQESEISNSNVKHG
jgi:hypothetical protein